MFGSAGLEHMEKYGTTVNHFAKIAWKNHKASAGLTYSEAFLEHSQCSLSLCSHIQHSVNNPYSQFRDEYSLDDILKSRKVVDPLTMLQVSPCTPNLQLLFS